MPNKIYTYRYDAMATYFELRIAHPDESYTKKVAQAVWSIIETTESRLSKYQQNSEIASISRLTPGEVHKVSPEVFHCLKLCISYQIMTDGAFDPALGSYASKRGQLLMDEDSFLVGVDGGSVSLDLGAIGKGYALDLAAEELHSWDINEALLVGGGSSLLALESPDPKGWKIGIGGSQTGSYLYLKNNALGSSGTSIKGDHILDPSTGKAFSTSRRTWAIANSAAQADALSTAWIILEPNKIQSICNTETNISAVIQDKNNPKVLWTTEPNPLCLN
jgi:thiamine biosynthesis lipoprotein